MSQDELENFYKKRDYLDEWLSRHKEAHDIVPHVRKIQDMTNWEIEALENRPTSSGEMPSDDIMFVGQRDYEYVVGAIPMIPEFDSDVVASAMAVNTSSTATIYTHVVKWAEADTSEAEEYSKKFTGLYHDLQTKQKRPEEVRALIAGLSDSSILGRFDKALEAYSHAKAGTVNRTDAALAMRNLIEGIKGKIYQLARKQEKENMTWPIMAERLAKGEPQGTECNELEHHKSIYSPLHERLSYVLKEREGGSPANLDQLWTQVLDHIYAVLGLVKLP